MPQPRRHTLFLAFACSLLATVLILPALAFSEPAQNLAKRLPGNNKLVVGVEVSSVKSSPLYKETMAWVRTQSAVSDILNLLETEGDFDLDKDLQSIAMVSPEVPTSIESAFKMPLTIALSGTFDREKITAAAKTKFPELVERKEAKLTVLGTEGRDISFVDKDTLLIILGPKPYLTNSWKELGSNKSTHNGKFQPVLKDVAANNGIWILIDSQTVTAPETKGAKANFSAVALRMTDSLVLTLLSHLQDEAAAAKALQEAEKLKSDAQSNPMVAMMGLTPLLKTMAIRQDNSKLWVTSTLTAAETRALMTRMRAIAERSQSLQKKPAQPNLTIEIPQTADPAQSDTTTRPAPKQGAAADFN